MTKLEGCAWDLMHSEIHGRQQMQAETIQSSDRIDEAKNLL